MSRSALSRSVIAVAAFALLGGCGGSKSDSSAAPTTTGAADAVTTSAVGTSASGASTTQPSGGGPPATAIVDIKNTAFAPSDAPVSVLGKVTWTFSDTVDHQVVADDGSFKSDAKNSGTFVQRFEKAGTFKYHCGIHPFMKGTITAS